MPQKFHSFMSEALYGENGYYTHGRNFETTPPRDFTTAPELTPLFGATLAHWVHQEWQRLGAPAALVLAELGPGRGSLMHPLLTQLQDIFPACFQALQQVQLIEVSPHLQTLQQETMKHWSQVSWHTALQPCPLPRLVIGNEVLDALPAQPYRLTDAGWEELWVTGNTPEWRVCEPPVLPMGWQPQAPAHYDAIPALPAFLEPLKQADAVVLIDYGAESLPPHGAATVQAMQRHQPVSLMHEPGHTDLTVHIHFAEVAAQLGAAHCTLQPLADFLLCHKLPDLALPLLPHAATESALHRLLHPAHMGQLHKVLCYRKPAS